MLFMSSDLRTVTDPKNRTATMWSDILGRNISVTDPLSRTSRVEYDIMGRVTKSTDPMGQISTTTYNPNSMRLTFTDPRLSTITWTYDTKERVATRKDALNQLETYTFDLNDNRATYKDRRNLTRTTTYDALDRAKLTTYADNSTVTRTYDAADRLTQIVDSVSGTITHTYDGLDRVTQQTTPQGTVNYTYDAAHRRTSMTVTYGYDDANRLTSITQNAKVTTLTYDDASRLTKMTMPNGVEKNLTYDNASQLATIVYKKGTVTIGDLNYTLDPAGQITEITGSLARTTLPAATTATAVYDANNRLTSWNGQAITYDAQGNMQSFSGSTYVWDARNRMSSITGTNASTFQYDPLGRRTSKKVPITSNIATLLTYDGANPAVEKQGTTVTGTNLTGLGIDSFMTRIDAATETYPLTDHLGSTVALTDAAGNIVTSYTYEPYGATTQAGTVSKSPHQYTGRENDGTGLYYYRARYYDPRLMRFISEDPIGLGGGVNMFAYVGGNPIGANDPTGEIAFLALIPAAAVIGGGIYSGSQGYQAGKAYGRAKCKTKQKFDANKDGAPYSEGGERMAERAENIGDLANTLGPFALRAGIGVALAGAGGSFAGAGVAAAGAAGGFYFGNQNCPCE